MRILNRTDESRYTVNDVMPSIQAKELADTRIGNSTHRLRRLLVKLQADASLFEPHELRKRIDALDQLDAILLESAPPELAENIWALRTRLEAANAAIYHSIRTRLKHCQPDELLKWVHACTDPGNLRPGVDYDALDELIGGIFQFRQPSPPPPHPGPEMVFYQPTPVRHILEMIRLSKLRAEDVLIDLGSGLGHVPILASILTGARAVGIEINTALVNSARACAHCLRLDRVEFFEVDAREADLADGTLFFLYTPFTGSILENVLQRLPQKSAHRPIRICTLGPCAHVIAEKSCFTAITTVDSNQITCFRT